MRSVFRSLLLPRMVRTSRGGSIAVAIFLVCGPLNVVLGQTDANRLEEIVVTAQKRDRSLQDVAVSVAAFGAEDIERLALVDSEELLLGVTGLDIRSNAGSSNANVFLRGVGSAGINFNMQSGVGMYVDEVALNSPVVNILQLFDLERVEVMRGPQNTLYGRNTTGGAVNFITRKPVVGEEGNGFASAGFGQYSELNVEGAVSAPLGDNAAVRIAAQSQTRDGIRRNLTTGEDQPDRNKFAARVQLAIEPAENVSINLKAHVEDVASDNNRFKNAGAFAPNATGPEPAQACATPFELGACSNGFGFVDSADPQEISSDMSNPENNVDASGASAHINVDFENFTLTSITGYEQNSQDLSEDSDAYPAHSFHFFIQSEQEQTSQEFRLTSNADQRFRWIVGTYGFWEEKTGTTGPTWATPMGIMLVRSVANWDNTSYSAYAEVEYDVSENLALVGGYRGGSDNIQGNTIALFAFQRHVPNLDLSGPSYTGSPLPPFPDLLSAAEANGALVLRVGGPSDPDARINDTTFNEWGGKAGVEYRPNDDLLVYGHWTRGYKAGLFPNAPMAIMLGLGDTPNLPENVNNYEVGVKADFADGRARVNAAAYFSDYQDQQLNQFILGEFRVISVDSEITGADVDFSWIPAEGFYVDAGLSVLNTELTKSPDTRQIGNELLHAPRTSARISLRKDWDLGGGSLLGIGADGRYVAERFFELSNTARDGPYSLINAHAYFVFGDQSQYRVSLWGKNITDALYYNNRFIFDDSGDGYSDYHVVYPSDPTTFGVTFKADF